MGGAARTALHSQAQESTAWTQAASFLQGCDAHSSRSASQFSPDQPALRTRTRRGQPAAAFHPGCAGSGAALWWRVARGRGRGARLQSQR